VICHNEESFSSRHNPEHRYKIDRWRRWLAHFWDCPPAEWKSMDPITPPPRCSSNPA
jgi:hypothetical protein